MQERVMAEQGRNKLETIAELAEPLTYWRPFPVYTSADYAGKEAL